MSDSLAHKLSRELLGPVIHFYLLQLDHHIRQLDDGNTRFLFVSRAGVRIRRLYEAYLEAGGVARPDSMEDFWVSRLLLSKGIYGRAPGAAIDTIGRELKHHSLEETVGYIFAAELAHGGMERPAEWAELPAAPLHEFVTSDHLEAVRITAYLSEQSALFERYLGQVFGDSGRGVLIDSGWQGTAQAILSNNFKDREWFGLYFGRMAIGNPIPGHLKTHMVGLMFESDQYDPAVPESAFALHRHLVENLFEPNAPSIERLQRREDATVYAPESDKVLADPADPVKDAHYLAVLDYLRTEGVGLPAAEILKRHRVAMEELARMLREPTEPEALALMGKSRSADYGRSLRVPVLYEPEDRNAWDSKEKRVRESLWPHGQIAREYAPRDAVRRQRALVPAVANVAAAAPDAWSVEGRVAIITRTKDRPVLFRRAARSVAQQTYQNYVWMVVNDGGEPEEVKAIIEQSGVDPRRVVLCSNGASLGMEAASNVGIRASDSAYVIIHDDDDSWAPEFLQAMVGFLESKDGRKYGGAISKSLYVSESIEDDRVIEHGRWPYQDWVQTVQLSEMINGNFFAPIAFLFRRSVGEKVGFFDESLPVLGDWDFNLKFLMEADIAVVPKALAYYHHRDVGTSSAGYSNSVIGANNKHMEYNALVRNRYIRGTANGAGMTGLLASLGYSMCDLRGRIGAIGDAIANQQQRKVSEDESTLNLRLLHMSKLADDRWVVLQLLTDKGSGWMKKETLASKRAREMLQAGGGRVWREELIEFIKETGATLQIPPDFDEAAYLKANPDVAGAVKRQEFSSGFHHFYVFGYLEGRKRPESIVHL